MCLRVLHLDLETYSSAPLPKCGVYRYCDAPDFEILLFSYAFDDEPVKTVDLASGETLPKEVITALEDPDIIKVPTTPSLSAYACRAIWGTGWIRISGAAPWSWRRT